VSESERSCHQCLVRLQLNHQFHSAFGKGTGDTTTTAAADK
jgi:hypothetical protein